MKRNWFSKYDFLTIQTPLSYKNDYFYKTKIGAFLSFLIFLFVFFITIYEIMILYQKSSFTLIYNQYTDLSQKIDFSQTPFLFQISNDNGEMIELDHKLVVIEAYDVEVAAKIGENGIAKNLKSTKLELEKCDQLFSNKSEYSSLNLSKYICIKPNKNLTSYGIFGDINNSFKGIRIYINRCSGEDCYNITVFKNKLHNAKFLITYLSLSSNIFYLNNEDLKYQLFTKYFSLSTNILKKITFTFDIGRFHLKNNILYGNTKSFNYILGNDYSIDVDLDPSNTFSNNAYTLAYIGFHYGGSIIETRKEVRSFFESISFVGNLFNIILTIFKVINSYYSHKILFVDIFKSAFFEEDKNNLSIKENIHLNNILNLNESNILNKRKNIDISEVFCINKNTNKKLNSIESLNMRNISVNASPSMIKNSSKTKNLKADKNLQKKLLFYYLFPICILKKNNNYINICLIKEKICGYFSIENINELMIFKEKIEEKLIDSKKNNFKLIKIENKI